MDRVLLGMAQAPWACLREITGREEQAVSGVGLPDALALLDALLVGAPGGALEPGTAASLAAPDRDRLLAAVYVRSYGSQVRSTLRCVACEAPFDLEFELEALCRSLEPSGEAAGVERSGDGSLRLADGVRFRFPTGADECRALGMQGTDAEEALFHASLLDPADGEAFAPALLRPRIETVLRSLAPLLDARIEARCPECAVTQEVTFDVQDFLLRSFLADQPRLDGEVHGLAVSCRWGLHEILSLPRARRRALVERVAAMRGAGRWA